SSLEARDRSPELAAFDLRELVSDTVATWKSRAKERNIALSASFDPLPLSVTADISMIGRALGNLVDNAIRYTPPGGSVRIDTERRDGAVALSVSDTGYGIPEDEQPAVFDLFYRARDTNVSGTGLGLAIVKRILELHGTAASLSSEVGKGS